MVLQPFLMSFYANVRSVLGQHSTHFQGGSLNRPLHIGRKESISPRIARVTCLEELSQNLLEISTAGCIFAKRMRQ